jgi:hypothetical protein
LAAVRLVLVSAIGQAVVAGICRLLARLLLMKEVLLLVTLHTTVCSFALTPHHLE